MRSKRFRESTTNALVPAGTNTQIPQRPLYSLRYLQQAYSAILTSLWKWPSGTHYGSGIADKAGSRGAEVGRCGVSESGGKAQVFFPSSLQSLPLPACYSKTLWFPIPSLNPFFQAPQTCAKALASHPSFGNLWQSKKRHCDISDPLTKNSPPTCNLCESTVVSCKPSKTHKSWSRRPLGKDLPFELQK